MSAGCGLGLVGTNSVGGSRGIYSLDVGADGRATVLATHPAYNSGATAVTPDGGLLFAAVEAMTFRGLASGGCESYRVCADGRLERLSGAPTLGQRPCCLAYDPATSTLLAANFFGGSIARIQVGEDGVLGSAELLVAEPPPTGDGLHAMHAVVPLDEGRLVLGVSLSRGEVVAFRSTDGSRVAAHGFGPGAFPRSLAVAPDGSTVYCVRQDTGEVVVLANQVAAGDGLPHLQTVSAQPTSYRGDFGMSALRCSPDGRLLVAATRGNHTLSVFTVLPDGRIELDDVLPLPGAVPRDVGFSPDGTLLLAALQGSDQVSVHLVGAGSGLSRAVGVLAVPSPASVVFAGGGR